MTIKEIQAKTEVFDYILFVPIALGWAALQLLISAMGFS
jgi:hypothetical protein